MTILLIILAVLGALIIAFLVFTRLGKKIILLNDLSLFINLLERYFLI